MRMILEGVGARFIAPWDGKEIPHVPMNLLAGIIAPIALLYSFVIVRKAESDHIDTPQKLQ